MSNEFEEREQIKNPEEFKKLVKNNKKDFSNYAFMFAFSGSDSELLIKTFTKKASKFDGAVFTKEVKFYKIDIPNDITFNNITFQETLTFDSVNFSGNFCAMGCTFYNIQFLSSEINELKFLENNFLEKFKVSQNDDQQRKGRDHKVKIKTLCFMNNTVEPGKLVRFGYLDVDYFRFDNMNNPINSEINIGECDFNNFYLRNLRNKGKCIIYRINTKREKCDSFKLLDSSLGDSEVQDINLACYENVIVQDNRLSGLEYTAVQWPDNIKADTDQKKRDTYRTLKNVAQKNNDAPQAIAFYAKEMEAYSHTLSWISGQFFDKFILKFNRWTNNFGLTWWLPILWILGFGLVLYLLLLLSIDSSDCCICKEWKKFLVFLNPTHKIGVEFIDGQWGFWAYLFDLSFRIIEATLIYQTIIAFRKFTRKL